MSTSRAGLERWRCSPLVGDLDDFFRDGTHPLRDLQLIKVSHGRILAHDMAGRPAL